MAIQRGFTKPGGVPDHFRAARVILKDFVTGKLLFCKAPPGSEQPEYHAYSAEAVTKYAQGGDDEDEIALSDTFPEMVTVRSAAANGANGVHVRGVKAMGMVREQFFSTFVTIETFSYFSTQAKGKRQETKKKKAKGYFCHSTPYS